MITAQQIQTVKTVVPQLNQQIQRLQDWINSVDALQKNNWVLPQAVGGAVFNFTFGQAEQDQLVATYQAMKTALATAYGQLP